MRYLLIIITVAFISYYGYSSEAFADVSYADIFLDGKGYRPAKETWALENQTPQLILPGEVPENLRYKEWCMNTFDAGEYIYEAYKEIAFSIEYQAEPPKTDFWQTPLETRRYKQGDCEDSVFLFFSHLSQLDIDGDIVWGWVIDKERSDSFAHVWYQLFDKHGKTYIVEGFSKEWNGIIPIDEISSTEERIANLTIRHNQINQIVDEMIPSFGEIEDTQQSWNIFLHGSKIMNDIFHKLHVMFARYREQMKNL